MSERQETSSVKGVLSDLIINDYVYDAIIALGEAKGNALPLPVIAKVMGLSERRARQYLEQYSKSHGIKLFKRIELTDGVEHYGLTKKGLEVYRRLFSYGKVKRSSIAKLFRAFLRSPHVKIMLKRLLYIEGFGAIAVLTLTIAVSSTVPLYVYAGLIAVVSLMLATVKL